MRSRPASPDAPADDHAMTRDQIAAALGLSRERVRQIEVRAMYKCRDWLAERGLDAASVLPESSSE